MARAGDVDRTQVAGANLPVQVRVEQIQARHRAEVAEQAKLDVLGLQRLAQQRVVEQVNLADRQVVGRAPVGVDQTQLVLGQGRRRLASQRVRLGHLSASARGQSRLEPLVSR